MKSEPFHLRQKKNDCQVAVNRNATGFWLFENLTHIFTEDYPTDHKLLPKTLNINAVFLICLKINPRVFQQLYRVLGIHVLLKTEFAKVELPQTKMIADPRQVATLIGQSQAKLDKFQQVYIAPAW